MLHTVIFYVSSYLGIDTFTSSSSHKSLVQQRHSSPTQRGDEVQALSKEKDLFHSMDQKGLGSGSTLRRFL